jgi:alpha-methylacyl-CoA racemase
MADPAPRHPLPLAGVRILDCTRLLPGQHGGNLLADLGAEVLKVEIPGSGDYGRDVQGDAFAALNRGRKSVTLDLTTPPGQRIFKQLAMTSEAVYESFRPGVMKRFGLDHESLRDLKPALVYCSQSGYGADGPYRSRPGHDINYVGVAGMVQPRPGDPPRHPSMAVADMAVGVYAAYIIVACLLRARATGIGEFIDLSMLDVALDLNLLNLLAGGGGDRDPRHVGDAGHAPGGDPGFAIYRCRDGRHLTVAAVEPKFWAGFVRAIGCPELEPSHGATGERGVEIGRTIQSIVGTRTLAEWEDVFRGLDVTVAPVWTAAEVADDPQVHARGSIWQDEAGGLQIGFPGRLAGGVSPRAEPAPTLGQHTRELLAAIGYRPEELERLAADGVI